MVAPRPARRGGPSARQIWTVAFSRTPKLILRSLGAPFFGGNFPCFRHEAAGDVITFVGGNHTHASFSEIRRDAMFAIAFGARRTGKPRTSNQ